MSMLSKIANKRSRSALRRFGAEEEGTATIEAVLWLPAFFFAFMAVLDVSMIFYNKAHLTRLVQDANRNMSIGRLASTADTETYIEQSMKNEKGITVNASTTMNAGVIDTVVSVPTSEVDMVGMIAPITNTTIMVRAQHLAEF